MSRNWTVAAVAVAGFAVGWPGSAWAAERARAELMARSGSQVAGEVTFEEGKGGVLVRVNARGVSPGEHAIHVHEKGDCSAPDGTSAGGHFNPLKKPHGGPGDKERHAGDLGNVTADGAGNVKFESLFAGITLGKGPTAIVGKSVILHAKRDDMKTQPTGDAGGRIACGIVQAVK